MMLKKNLLMYSGRNADEGDEYRRVEIVQSVVYVVEGDPPVELRDCCFGEVGGLHVGLKGMID